MNRRLSALVAFVLALGLALPARAGWDPSKPPTGGNLVSADIRANWSAIEQSLSGDNLIADPIFLIWAAGDAAAPTHYTLNGAGAVVARTGTGLGDTNRKLGAYAAKVTAGGGATGYLQQNLLPATMDDGWQGASISCGAWVRATVASSGRLTIFGGFSNAASGYHTGSGAWEWLSLTTTTVNPDTMIAVRLEAAASQTVYFSGLTCVVGQIPPKAYIPAPVIVQVERRFIAGVQTVGNSKVGTYLTFARPTIVRSVWAHVQTAVPTGAALIVRPNHYDGAVFQPLYTTLPQIAAGQAVGNRTAPDGTYRWRCFTGQPAAGSVGHAADTLLGWDVTQIGSIAAGTDLYLNVEYVQYARPLEAFLGPQDWN
jgi:hypothetical protein